jgi:putative membrane protein
MFANFSVANYAIHLAAAAVLLVVFFFIYTRATPYDEIVLIRQGNSAAALSLAGALVGFSLTVGSGIIHSNNVLEFIAWSVLAMVVQVAAYAITVRLVHISQDQIESGNAAFGGLLGAISVAVGIINAASLS